MSTRKSGRKLPAYCTHKPSGRAYVRLTIDGNRETIYIGLANSEESYRNYDEVVGEWLATKQVPIQDNGPTVLAVAERFKSDQQAKLPDSKKYHLVAAIKLLADLFENRPASEFDALQFSRLRSELIERNYARKYANDILGILKRCFRWAMQRELITPDQFARIESFEPLSAKEAPTKIVEPANDDDVSATLPLLSKDFQDTIAFLRATGCRPGEARLMKVGEIDRDNWMFKPAKHKTAHKGKSRYVPIPSSVREILLPRLLRPDAAYVLGADNGERPYEKRSLGRAIDHAIKRINRERSKADLPAIPHWHPYQLRHARATEVREQYGVEVAQSVLGHARVDTTEIYAKQTEAKAKEVAKLIG